MHYISHSRRIKSILSIKFVYYASLISDSIKTIKLLVLDFYEMIVDSGLKVGLINYHLIEISTRDQFFNLFSLCQDIYVLDMSGIPENKGEFPIEL